MIITILSETDRVGKSILAVNLAALRVRDGGKVLLIDADSDRNLSAWGTRRANAVTRLRMPFRAVGRSGLYSELQGRSARYGDIVIDAGDIDAFNAKCALVAAKLAIIPIQINAGELAGQERLIKGIERAKLFNPCLRTLLVITRAPEVMSTQDLATAEAFARRLPSARLANTIVHDFNSFYDAFSQGISVVESQVPDASATMETEKLCGEIYQANGSASRIGAGVRRVASLLGHFSGRTVRAKQAPPLS
jgi:cellulose biosynthesis protein BcsQ